jgi:hypothetical protein
LRRLRAVGKQWKHTKDGEHGGNAFSHAPIMPADHKTSKKMYASFAQALVERLAPFQWHSV